MSKVDKIPGTDLTLSIVIVSYNVRDFLGQALTSIQKALLGIAHEIFVVDNASTDGSVEYLEKRHPEVNLIANKDNVGFGKANNQALIRCKGKYICVINPDTIVQEDTFKVLIEFFEKHPEAGAIGSKILNPDGTLQLACRRSFPTPWVAFTKIAGLATLFPGSKLFGRYNLTYLDPEQVAEVDAISGSFMLLRKEVVDTVGGFDEAFFMYGEDLDWCYRINNAGWKIYYVPHTQIVHFKGESSKKSPFAQRRLFYEAMRLFVNKHFSGKNALFPSWFLVLAIKGRALLAFISGVGRHLLMPGIDIILMALSLVAAILIRFYPEFPWKPFVLVNAVYTIIWLASLTGYGLYSRNKFSGTKSIAAMALGLVINSALTFFFKQYGFSRAVILYSGLINFIIIPGWRTLLRRFVNKPLKSGLWQQRSIIVGDIKTSAELISRIRVHLHESYKLVGVVLNAGKLVQEEVSGLPVLGTMQHLTEIIRREKIQEVIFATDKIDYEKMLAVIAGSNDSGVTYKMVPGNLDVIIGKASIDYIQDIPFVDLEYKLHSPLHRMEKRVFDVVAASLVLLFAAPAYAWLVWIRRVPLQTISINGPGKKSIELREFSDIRMKSVWRHIPWMFSIIRGDISFVGREIIIDPVKHADDASLSLKPGLTGLEQLNRNREIADAERVKYNIYYLKNYSLLLDLQIILKAVFTKNNN